jgi:hypothetical protein
MIEEILRSIFEKKSVLSIIGAFFALLLLPNALSIGLVFTVLLLLKYGLSFYHGEFEVNPFIVFIIFILSVVSNAVFPIILDGVGLIFSGGLLSGIIMVGIGVYILAVFSKKKNEFLLKI